MAKNLGQPVIIENHTGAVLIAQRAANAKPDGYTILNTNVGFAASATMYRRTPYSVTESFEPLGLVSEAAMTVVSRPDLPARDIASYLDLLRKEGDKLNLAHAGLGSSSHLCGMLVQQAAGATATAIAYRGSAQITTELMAGRVDIFCDQITNTMPYIRDKRFPVYAVTSEGRVAELDVPTMAEAGKPSATMTAWHGIFAPAGVPGPILDRLSIAVQASLREEKLRARFESLVTQPASQERATRAFHKRFHAEEVARWRTVIQAAGAYAD
jgi:tripartite-type tricarboxylate transporter receptor subunit TctC